MKHKQKVLRHGLSLLTATAALIGAGGPLQAQDKKPNILFIMGDDIGWMQPSCYHRGLMVGETPNIDRIAKEGAIFMHYYAEQSCTAGRNSFITGMHPLRTGLIPPQLPGSPSYLRPGTPCLAKFLLDLGYTTGEFGKNHLGDHPDALPTAHGFQEFWGYLYHLDAMQGVSFPDINKTPTQQGVVPPCEQEPIPGIPQVPGAIDPKTGVCLTPPRPVLWMKSPDGTAKNQMGKDEGPLTLERSKTVDEEISTHVIDWLDRNDPKKTGKPFFVWYNPARMHITTVLSDKYMAMVGEPGGKDWGVNEAGMKQMDDNIGYVFKKLEDMGEMDNTIIVFTTDNGAENITYPDGGVTPFRGGKLTTWEGGMRAPCVIRWPEHIKPGTVLKEVFASLDWLPTFVDVAGGLKGDGLKKQIEAGSYPGIVKTTLDGVDQRDYLEGKSDKSARDTFFYYTGAKPSAVRYKNWKFYYTMVPTANPADALIGAVTYHWSLVDNIKRDPFEMATGETQGTMFGVGGALAGPVTAYVYDWNLLPIGQVLWLKELESYIQFPPLQSPESYNLTQVLEQVRQARHIGAYLLFGFFCGIRSDVTDGELQKLDWSDVHLVGGSRPEIEIRPSVAKTGRRRFVGLSDNALAWIEAYRQRGGEMEGPIVNYTPDALRNRRRKAQEAAGLEHWIKAGMRHSFCSYWLAKHKDVNRLVLESGHDSPDTMWRHYHRGVTELEAEKFWAILPPAELPNVIPIKKR